MYIILFAKSKKIKVRQGEYIYILYTYIYIYSKGSCTTYVDRVRSSKHHIIISIVHFLRSETTTSFFSSNIFYDFSYCVIVCDFLSTKCRPLPCIPVHTYTYNIYIYIGDDDQMLACIYIYEI